MRFLVPALVLMACGTDTDQEKENQEDIEVVKDNDGDGYLNSEDCDDNDPQINPGAEEICDGFDNNCDGQADEDVTETFYADSDGDGFGNENIQIEACTVPAGYVSNGSDCDDTHAESHPSAEEICDGLDNNCDEAVDEDLLQTFYVDNDRDGYGDENQTVEACALDLGLSLIAEDCDDNDAGISPGQDEKCDGFDNNCDGNIDEGTLLTYYPDLDEDGYGDENVQLEGCEVPPGHVTVGGDCDDLETYAHPIMIEFCDEIDNDCNGEIDESGSIGEMEYYADTDSDGHGDPNNSTLACSIPAGHVENDQDCNDNAANINPDADEYCNSIDDDCNGLVDESTSVDQSIWHLDFDGDGTGGSSHSLTQCYAPSGYVSTSDDCDDSDPNRHPNATEICDNIDNDCDNLVDADDSDFDSTTLLTFFLDGDSDGFGDPAQSNQACQQPAGHVENDEDCDDNDNSVGSINNDADCDGVQTPVDCDDSDANMPNLDQDCDGFLTADDCNDNNASVADLNGQDPSCPGASCLDILDSGNSIGSGDYWIETPSLGTIPVFCEMSYSGGGWTMCYDNHSNYDDTYQVTDWHIRNNTTSVGTGTYARNCKALTADLNPDTALVSYLDGNIGVTNATNAAPPLEDGNFYAFYGASHNIGIEIHNSADPGFGHCFDQSGEDNSWGRMGMNGSCYLDSADGTSTVWYSSLIKVQYSIR